MSAPTNLHRDIGRLEGKLDAVLVEMRGSLMQAHAILDNHGQRLEAIETLEDQRRGAVKAARWLWGGLTAALGLLIGLLGHLYGTPRL